MGIKGIYRELGPGQRISLAKLAIENLERTGKPLRIAIDIAIWQFQTQAAKGGANPAIRTLFYRLVRLLSLPVQPIFVFDGPDKPVFKRNKRSGRGDGTAAAMAKRLIRLFGLPIHQAPGEAEAECALLQQHGLVDAVLSEDVDTIMFGCDRTFRNWSAEGIRAGKSPTHVTVYDVNEPGLIASALDREGMVLVALMSGGDYLPEGVPGCGLKLACEVARAGFGKTLCSIKATDKAGMDKWRANLAHELRTNESKFFRTKHKAISIPDTFPSVKVLQYYTHPAVSARESIQKLAESIEWSRSVDINGLRQFTAEAFDWTYRPGAVKLIRVLSPTLLVQKLLRRYDHSIQFPASDDLESVEQQELTLIRQITARRSHFSMDGAPELRVSHVPADIVPLDLSQEMDEVLETDRRGLALNSDDGYEVALLSSSAAENRNQLPRKTFDPRIPQLTWLPESLVKLGVPLCVEDWEAKQRAKTLLLGTAKPTQKKKKSAAEDFTHKAGALDQWLKPTKPPPRARPSEHVAEASISRTEGHFKSSQPLPSSMAILRSRGLHGPAVSNPRMSPHRTLASLPRSKPLTSKSAGKPTPAGTTRLSNPWAFSGSQHTPRISKPYRHADAIFIESSPENQKGPSIALDVDRDQASTGGSQNELCSKEQPIKSYAEADLGAVRHDEASAKSDVTAFTARIGRCRTKTGLIQASMTSFVVLQPRTWGTTAESGQCPTQPRAEPVSREICVTNATRPSASRSLMSQIDMSSKSDKQFGRSHRRESSPTPHGRRAGGKRETVTNGSSPKTNAKVIVPRTSACGFFKEVEVGGDEAAQLMACETDQRFGHEYRTTARKGIWKQSQVAVVDLTGED